jgi:iron complex outermembrane receptor protein
LGLVGKSIGVCMCSQITAAATVCVLLLIQAVARGDPAAFAAPATQPAAPAARPAVEPNGTDLTQLPLEDLMNVDVTSVSKKKQSIGDAPAAVSVISADDISRSGYSTIPDLLRLAPGVDVGQINSFTWGIGVRGLNDEFANKLLVLQDGRSLYTPLFGGVYWDTVDYVLEDLDRIEVIRGPGATLWGADAVDGVINITSKDSRDTQGWLLSLRGSNEDSDFSVRYGGRLSDDTTYRVYLKAKYTNEFDDARGDSAGDDWYGLRGGFRIDKHPSDDDTFTLQGDVGDNRIRQPTVVTLPGASVQTVTTMGRTDASGNLLGRWEHRSGDDSDFSLQVYYDYLKVDPQVYDYQQNTFDIDFHHRFKIGQGNEVSWGLGYRLIGSDISATPGLTGFPPTRNDNLFSAFVQDTLTLQPEKWFLTIGSKFEHNDYTGFEVEPSARLLWKPDKQNSVWAAVSRAVSTPSRVEENARVVYQTGGTGIDLASNPNQKSEELVAFELGYRTQPVKDVSIDIAAFYNKYDRLRSEHAGAPISISPLIIPVTWENDVAGDTFGGEVSATVRLSETWRLQGSYSLLDARFGSPDPGDLSTASGYAGSAPRNQAQIHSYLDLTRDLQLNVGLSYVGRVPEFGVPAYVSTDLSLVWRPKDSLEFRAGVTNLFDNHHPEFGTSGGQEVAAETPRSVYVQVIYRF